MVWDAGRECRSVTTARPSSPALDKASQNQR